MSSILIICGNQSGEYTPDTQDTLLQVGEVYEALTDNGHSVRVAGISLNLNSLKETFLTIRPDLVFNLVEDLEGKSVLQSVPLFLLDSMRIPYTGCPSEAIAMTNNKVFAKEVMKLNEIKTPSWAYPVRRATRPHLEQFILKPTREHASIGISLDSVVSSIEGDPEYRNKFELAKANGFDLFAEEFIQGREFSVSVMGTQDNFKVWSPAEHYFNDPKVTFYTYDRKWMTEQDEYKSITRKLTFSEEDAHLINHLQLITRKCWRVFNLSGYARVDFRVDSQGIPYVLEINTNPCLSKDAGFVASAETEGISYRDLIERIVWISLGIC